MRYRSLAIFAVLIASGCTTAIPVHTEAVTHNDEGARLLSEGDLEDAEARFRLALEYNPKFAESRANLGIVAFRHGDLEKAEQHLKGAIRLNRDFAEAWSSLGVVYEAQGRPEDARLAYVEALSIQPGLADPRRNLALWLVGDEEFTRARAHLIRLVQIVPDDVVVQSLLAYCDVRLERFDPALKRAEAVLDAHPDEVIAYVVRGIVHAHREDWQLAERDLRVGLNDSVVGRAAQQRLAAVYAARGDRPAAWRLVRELLATDPDDAAAQVIATWMRQHPR